RPRDRPPQVGPVPRAAALGRGRQLPARRDPALLRRRGGDPRRLRPLRRVPAARGRRRSGRSGGDVARRAQGVVGDRSRERPLRDGCGGVAPARRRGPATRARGPRGDAHLRHPAREERRLAAAPAAPLRDPRLDRLRGRRAAGGAAHRGGRGRDARREAGAAAAAAGAPARRGRGRRQRRRLQAPRRRDRRRRARRRRPRRLRGAARLAAGARPRRGRAALRGRERPHLARRRTPAAARPRRPRAVSRHRARQGGALRRGAAGGAPGARRPVTADRFVALFPLWLLIGAAAALAHPPLLVWFLERGLVTPGLAVIMLGMGLTLEADDFARVLRRPAPVVLGLALQYGVMPAAGVAAAELWGLPRAFAAGVILVCCCPGGTASNVVTYLARADVP